MAQNKFDVGATFDRLCNSGEYLATRLAISTKCTRVYAYGKYQQLQSVWASLGAV